ncbi:hypothetical protein FHS29_006233 [Saccharothrix tamanrassetensis]|uniref:Lipoprotein n=1 Tax=Saccharothrix tamanrassetensis TaxID=1051531 RepID=A0A841CMB2_9PSEU|nr:hypothetical protein [Saccharothrix tamanrassetensis]MBB5959612.1 hypothetical protein [Saccharothrix tamanrassetensis]
MRTLYRLIAAGALSAPLLIGAAGLASADTDYHQSHTGAGPYGAYHHSVWSGTDGHNHSYYHEHFSWAGPEGAGTGHVSASAGDHYGHDHDDD